jgi:dUTP pyrophosphatase
MCCKDKPVIKFKKMHPDAKPPTRAHPTDAGLDLYACEATYIPEYKAVKYDTGIAVAIPEGYVGLLFPRSSICKTRQRLVNSVGVIDSSFRGTIGIVMEDRFSGVQDPHTVDYMPHYQIGDKLAQLVVVPCLTSAIEVDELSDTARGQGGFGSSGT